VSDNINMTIAVSTLGEFTVPRWMTTFIRQLFAIPTHMTAQERLVLFETALGLPAGFTIVEIGSYLGSSTAFLAYAATTKAGTVHAIDPWLNTAMGSEGERDTFAEFAANTAPFEHYIVRHRATSVEVAQREAPIPCDLLFIDGDHSREAVLTDLRLWLPALKPGGVLAMHDIDHAGVKSAFDAVVGARVEPNVRVVDRLLICRPTGYDGTAQ
jgi:predicted O-methyltransferase YrrM